MAKANSPYKPFGNTIRHNLKKRELDLRFGDVYKVIRKKYVKEGLTEQGVSFFLGCSRGFVKTSLNRLGIKRLSHSEQMRKGYKSGKIKVNVEKAHLATRQLVQEGKHPFQKEEVHIKANKSLAKSRYCSFLEKKMRWLLDSIGIDYEQAYCIERECKKWNGRAWIPRYYVVDFYIPSKNLVIECDGKYWHRDKEKDFIRESEIKNNGFVVIRFGENEIRNDLGSVADRLKEQLRRT